MVMLDVSPFKVDSILQDAFLVKMLLFSTFFVKNNSKDRHYNN